MISVPWNGTQEEDDHLLRGRGGEWGNVQVGGEINTAKFSCFLLLNCVYCIHCQT